MAALDSRSVPMRRARANRQGDRSRVEDRTMTTPTLPWSVHENPLLSQWIDLSEPGIARVFSSKVENGKRYSHRDRADRGRRTQTPDGEGGRRVGQLPSLP